MYKYLIIIEKSRTGFSAYAPDLPGCVAVSSTKEKTEALMKEAIEFHIEGMLEEGLEIPKPTTTNAEFIKINFKKRLRKEFVSA
ncbi:MAG: type II toxin-antitoxin system HicB family antitoxin [Bacteroidota bacterium]|jgi:predicted RNase H-like HicB family nuclease